MALQFKRISPTPLATLPTPDSSTISKMSPEAAYTAGKKFGQALLDKTAVGPGPLPSNVQIAETPVTLRAPSTSGVGWKLWTAWVEFNSDECTYYFVTQWGKGGGAQRVKKYACLGPATARARMRRTIRQKNRKGYTV